MKLKSLVSTVSFFAVGIVLFWAVQRLLTPSWNYPINYDNTGLSVRGFYNLEEDTEEVFFMGTSHIIVSVSPMELYRDHGIISYNVGTSGQPIEVSRFLTSQIFRRQHPKVIVMDVSNLFLDFTDNSRNINSATSYVMDNAPFSIDKVRLAHDLQVIMDKRNEGSGSNMPTKDYFWSSLIPIIKYHDRWERVGEADFRDFSKLQADHYSFGLSINTAIGKPAVSVKEMNYYAEELMNTNRMEHKVIPEENIELLRDIKGMCDENDCELLLIKIPSVHLPTTYISSWTEDKSRHMKKVAKEEGIEFIDLLYDVDLGIDYQKDFLDGGMHLNYLGCLKVSSWLGDYLTENYDVGGKKSDFYDEEMKIYEKLVDLARIQMETDFEDYIDILLENADRYVIFIMARDDCQNGFDDEKNEVMHRLGLSTDFTSKGLHRNSYIAIIDRGNVVYEDSSHEALAVDYNIDDQYKVTAESKGFYAGDGVSLSSKGAEYARNYRGLNIVVFDRESECFIDSVCFDSYKQSFLAFRDREIIRPMFKQYEDYIINGVKINRR